VQVAGVVVACQT